jgi:hypothetical protein
LAHPRHKVNATLQSLLAKRPSSLSALGTIDRFEAELPTSKDDRGMALVSAALVEQLLEDAILVHCLKEFEEPRWRGRLFGAGNEGAVVTGFYAKIMLGHALGIYGTALREDLDRIRNVFAHTKVPLSFRSKAISRACEFHMFDSKLQAIGPSQRTNTPPKRFLGAVAISMIVLHSVTNKRRRYRPRARPNKTWVYAEPPTSPGKPKRPNRPRQRSGDQTPK